MTEPGTRAEYSDIGFIVLAELLARLVEEPLDLFCKREIFPWTAMRRSTFNPPLELKPMIPPSAEDNHFRKRVLQGEVQDENASALGGVAGHALGGHGEQARPLNGSVIGGENDFGCLDYSDSAGAFPSAPT